MTQRKKTNPSPPKHLSREAAERYLFALPGDASRHRTERQLPGDALSSDALDGLSTQKTPQQLAANLADLKNRLGQRVAQQRPRRLAMPFGMQPYAVAASVALILVCAAAVVFSTRYLWKKDVAAQMAQKQAGTQAAQNAPPVAAAAAPTEKTDPPAVQKSAAPAKKPAKPAAGQPAAGPQAMALGATATPPQFSAPLAVADTPRPAAETLPASVLDEQVVVASPANTGENDRRFERENSIPENTQTREETQHIRQRMAAPKAALRMAASSLTESRSDTSQTARTVRGKVTDAEDGVGLPGAVVTVRGTETGTYTDQYGNYSIVVPPGYDELAFSFIGYITYSTPVGGQPDISARLTPDVRALSEVVVVGYGGQKEKEAAFKPAQPVSGMTGFISTVSQTLSASPYASQLSAAGNIRVSFTVQPNGSLTDVKVPRANCAQCEAETAKALQQASRWQPAQEHGVAVPQKVKLRIPLKAKKKR